MRSLYPALRRSYVAKRRLFDKWYALTADAASRRLMPGATLERSIKVKDSRLVVYLLISSSRQDRDDVRDAGCRFQTQCRCPKVSIATML